jgi:uncharacterized protein
LHRAAWAPLAENPQANRRVLAPIESLTPEMAGAGPVEVTPEIRRTIVRALPRLVAVIGVFWREGESALFGAAPAPAPARAQKVGRNEPCPCGSGKKYKRCCGALA